MELYLLLAALLGVLLFTILLIVATLYKRTTKEESFVRTGMGGQKVILDGGAIKFPVFHELVRVNMRTLRLQVDRKNEEGLITADRMRVDVTAEFYVRVKPEMQAIAKAAQTLGDRTLQPEKLKELLQGKFVDALRSVAAGLTMEQLHEQRADFVQSVQASVSEDLLKNGLELESDSLTALDQTARQYFKDDNAFDAQGLAKLTDITEAKREERNRIEQDTRVKIELKNLEAEKKSLDIHRDEEMAKLDQRRAVEIAKAEQEALIARQQAQRKREAEESRLEESRKEQEAAIIAEQAVRERDITREQAIKERDIEARRMVEERDIAREQSVEVSRQTAAIVVANKSEEQSRAEAEAAKARAERVREEENVTTVKETAVASREKEIKLIKAREAAEEEAIEVTVGAEAEKQAAEDRAEAVRTQAKAEADRIRIVAEADEKRFEVEAYGEKAINEAKNLLSGAMIDFELRKLIAQIAPELVAASVKPMEKIESIKILQANGFGGMPGGQGTAPAAGGNGHAGLPQQLVDAALGYRMNLPVVDLLLKELGLSAKDLASLSRATAPDDVSTSEDAGDDAGSVDGTVTLPDDAVRN
ncbi:MAG: flotillin family protein [Verrucomicrobiota bacterium]